MSDHQYFTFRRYLPLLSLFYCFYILINRKFETKFKCFKDSNFQFLMIATFMFAVHGVNCVIPLLLICFNYACVKYFEMRKSFTWSFAIICLFLTEYFKNQNNLIHLIGFQGLFPRWSLIFNFSLLRMISFNLDYIELIKRSDGNKLIDHLNVCEKCLNNKQRIQCDRYRIISSLPIEVYSFKNYFIYTFYPPLYFSGPIISFNDFNNQIRNPIIIKWTETVKYFLRLFLCILCLEGLLHLFYVGAVRQSNHWDGLSFLSIFVVGYLNLKIIWLKLLIIWRYSRLVSLLDGIVVPENMLRCMSNNYSTLSFWRSWHRSFNLWILRYLYVPLGGRNSGIWSYFVVFGFVAAWHDFTIRMLIWSCFIPLIMLPELLSIKYLKPRLKAKFSSTFYSNICALGYSINIFLMLIGNLIGFSVGANGIKELINRMFENNNIFEIFSALFFTAFCSVKLMMSME